MKWIEFEPDKINFIDINSDEDNRDFYVFRYKDRWNFVNYFVGKLYKSEASEKITEDNYNGINRIVIERKKAKQWANNECPFGKYCDDEVDIKYITHYIPLAKESDELD